MEYWIRMRKCKQPLPFCHVIRHFTMITVPYIRDKITAAVLIAR